MKLRQGERVVTGWKDGSAMYCITNYGAVFKHIGGNWRCEEVGCVPIGNER